MTKAAHPHRANSLLSLDGRSTEGRLLRKVREELIAHVGGKPSATQKQIIEQICWLRLHITKMDAKALQAGEFSLAAGKQYLAWSNSLERLSRQLGLQGPKQKPPTAAEMVAALHARARAGVAA
ncbi:hypothetical protein [Lichenicoccus roseus]|uniref:Uncharacterized protein n=1 Tax=Lichenicoccus roseus TaxID=2683649 RepID=A0A5R9J7Z2_9PROT|nr:hypothetical protein [Lichenicoccus roseus]TLU71466.1 hypothetical protein FE263_16330 [Lichenicoccus roseus]